MIAGKSNQLGKHILIHGTTLLAHVTIMKTSYFDTDLALQMKLTKLPLIHCFFP